jgi:hypothetical protein
MALVFHGGNLKHSRNDLSVFPTVESNPNLGNSLAGFWRDPHGAHELVPSAAMIQRDRLSNRCPGVLARKFDLRDRMGIFGDTRKVPEECDRIFS